MISPVLLPSVFSSLPVTLFIEAETLGAEHERSWAVKSSPPPSQPCLEPCAWTRKSLCASCCLCTLALCQTSITGHSGHHSLFCRENRGCWSSVTKLHFQLPCAASQLECLLGLAESLWQSRAFPCAFSGLALGNTALLQGGPPTETGGSSRCLRSCSEGSGWAGTVVWHCHQPLGLLWNNGMAWHGSCTSQLLQNREAPAACSSGLCRHGRQCWPSLLQYLAQPPLCLPARKKALETQERRLLKIWIRTVG